MSTRDHIHLPKNMGEKAADAVANFVGSWSFVAIMTSLLAGWILWNVCPSLPHFDPPQFVLLNLCLSFIASYTGPFVMMSQNRQASRDRARDDLEASEIDEIFSGHAMLIKINQQQLEILELLREQQQKPKKRQEVTAKNGEKII